jgi:hypothetical protein
MRNSYEIIDILYFMMKKMGLYYLLMIFLGFREVFW